ncbi:hypothetical protein B0H14DRAFT_3106045 [Mycena olivaceomarginata]|nr:hypothetical protein B0H14DRAFT_3106045 [Mycena olivaceomarginata]
MDNPQHYQPLSYALHPPSSSTTPKPSASALPHNPQREEEEDEEENLVADHLNSHDHTGDSPANKPVGPPHAPAQEHQFLQEPDPGKATARTSAGVKNRKVASPLGLAPAKLDVVIHPTGTGTAPPELPNVNSQNQQYYEFQWRMLNLCAEFYGAAEELVKGTDSLVIAQCYQMGASKVDPLIMLNDAKRICDTLPAPAPAPAAVPSRSRCSCSCTAPAPAPAPPPNPAPPPSTVITNPRILRCIPWDTNHIHILAIHLAAPYPGPILLPLPNRSRSLNRQPRPNQLPPQASTSSPAAPSGSGNGGTRTHWSDEEVERLKKLAEDSKAASASKEIEWDWVAGQWGPGRTRHQILLKATNLGPQGERRRDAAHGPRTAAQPRQRQPSNTGSPAMSHTTSTPHASPAMSHVQRPPSANRHPAPAKATPTGPAGGLPWPMPTVAAANVSPVLTPSVQGDQRTSYYRPRPAPTDTTSGPTAAARTNTHQFMTYQNGPVQNSS